MYVLVHAALDVHAALENETVLEQQYRIMSNSVNTTLGVHSGAILRHRPRSSRQDRLPSAPAGWEVDFLGALYEHGLVAESCSV